MRLGGSLVGAIIWPPYELWSKFLGTCLGRSYTILFERRRGVKNGVLTMAHIESYAYPDYGCTAQHIDCSSCRFLDARGTQLVGFVPSLVDFAMACF